MAPTGTGNTALGAPNLTDDTWLYGGSLTRISQSIAKGPQWTDAGTGRIPRCGQNSPAYSLHLRACRKRSNECTDTGKYPAYATDHLCIVAIVPGCGRCQRTIFFRRSTR